MVAQREAASEDSTTSRLHQAETGLLRTFGGAVGNAAAAGVSLAQDTGSRATAIGSDLTNRWVSGT